MEWVNQNSDTIIDLAADGLEIYAGALLFQMGPPLAAAGLVGEVGSGGTLTVVSAPAAALGVTAVAAGGGMMIHGSANLGKDIGDLHWSNQAEGSGNAGNSFGAAREEKVAELTGGKIPSGNPGSPGLRVVKPNVGSSDVDVIGPNGEYIAVGGPAKAKNLGKLKEKLGILKYAADEKKVGSQAYFEKGTPQSALDVAGQVLGKENVFVFER
jgi:hypothetical protein